VSPESLLNLGIAKELVVIITSALPILELRGGIPVAMTLFDFPWYYSMLLAVIGNMLPVPFILFFMGSITRLLSTGTICSDTFTRNGRLDRFTGRLSFWNKVQACFIFYLRRCADCRNNCHLPVLVRNRHFRYVAALNMVRFVLTVFPARWYIYTVCNECPCSSAG